MLLKNQYDISVIHYGYNIQLNFTVKFFFCFMPNTFVTYNYNVGAYRYL